jgi:hypothetical protein
MAPINIFRKTKNSVKQSTKNLFFYIKVQYNIIQIYTERREWKKNILLCVGGEGFVYSYGRLIKKFAITGVPACLSLQYDGMNRATVRLIGTVTSTFAFSRGFI